jgi:AcrR family transcriptional regulator
MKALSSPALTAKKEKTPKASRAPQQRSGETQALLLKATLECVQEFGYGGTSTQLVAQRAGVSRGAQTHHFPTKASLLLAATARLTEEMVAALDADLAVASTSKDALEAFFNGIWRTIDGPLFVASLELLVAARTDADLRAIWQGGMQRLAESTDSHVREIAQRVRPQDPAPLMLDLYCSVLLVQAIALDGTVHERRQLHRQLFEHWMARVRASAFG